MRLLLNGMRKRNDISNLKIKLTDFGPLNNGEIEIKPLSIFIGRNMSGKSYAAMLIYSIFSCNNFLAMRKISELSIEQLPLSFGPKLNKSYVYKLLKNYPEFKNEISQFLNYKDIKVPEEIVKKIVYQVADDIFEKKLSLKIKNSFNCEINDLINYGNKDFKIELKFDEYNLILKSSKNDLKITKLSHN